MTQIKERAVEMIREMPDDKIIYIIEILKGLKGLYEESVNISNSLTDAQKALEGLKKYKGRISSDIDEKGELARAREEKYANFG